MSTKKPWFPLWAADWLTDTSQMSIEARGIYIQLLCFQWINGHVPLDHVKRARICGCSVEEMDKAWLELLGKFTGTPDDERMGRISNPRLEKVREQQDRFLDQKRAAGIASGAARRKKSNGSKDNERPFNPVDLPFGTDDERDRTSQSQSQTQTKEGRAAPRPPAKRKHRLPEDWEPDGQLLIWAKKEVPAVNVREETKIFRDYFLASGTPKVDWRRTWQVWMRKEQKGAARVKRRFTRTDAERVAKRENKIKLSGETWDAFQDRMQALDQGFV